MITMKMRYDNWKEEFDVNFSTYPEKYEQLKTVKARWWTIEVIIWVWDKTRKILSDDLHFYN